MSGGLLRGEGWSEPCLFPLPWPPLADNETQITLRPWGAAQGDPLALAEAWQDPDVARWTKVPPDPNEDLARTWIRNEERRRAAGLAIDLVVSQLDDPGVIHGEIGLIMVEPDEKWAELGYWLGVDSRGEGRAAAAARMFVEWALRELPINRIFARTHPDNPKAGAVAQAAGLVAAGSLETGTLVWIRERAPRR